MKKAVIIFGPPGAGKGTQANLLAWSRGFIHFDTGRHMERVVHDSANNSNPEIQEQKKIWESGGINSPEWALRLVTKEIKTLSAAGLDIVFSGSPRTLFEAIGDEDHVGFIATIEKEYGKGSIVWIELILHPDKSIFRNSNRKICTICNTGILAAEWSKDANACPVCGGKLERRKLDTPEVIKVRLGEYEKQTKPVIEEIKKRGFLVHEILGEEEPYRVFEKIAKLVDAI